MAERYTSSLLIILSILLVLAHSASGAEDFRLRWSEGETREYRLQMGSAEIGRERATYIGTQNVEDIGTIYEFDMASRMDLSPVGQDTELKYNCRIAYMSGGIPVQYEATYVEQEDTFRVKIAIRGNEVRGVFESEQGDSVISLSVAPGTYICDRNFVAHWDIVFGRVDPPLGDSVRMNVLIPRVVRRFPLLGIGVGTETIDYAGEQVQCDVHSVSTVNQRFYIGPEGNLLRVVDPRRSLIIERVPAGQETGTGGPGFFSTIHRRILIWFCYLLWAFLVLFFFIRNQVKRPLIAIVFVVTGALYGLIFLIQVPIQRSLAEAIFKTLGSTGSGAYVVSLLSGLLSALIQESLKLGPIWLLWYLMTKKPRLEEVTSFGAAGAAGFGFVESCWITGGAFAAGALGLVSITVIDRLTAMVFHTMTGVILGYGLGRRNILPFWLIAVAVHTFGKFLLVFLSTGALDVYFYQIFLIIYYLIVFFFVHKLLKNIRLR